MPKLSKMYEKYKDKIEVIGINLQENPAIVESYISSAGIVFPIALDPSGQTSRAYDIRYTNTHILIDKDGNIVKTIPGDIRESDIISLIQWRGSDNLLPDPDAGETFSKVKDIRNEVLNVIP